jgi:two-component system invasion response regulator UvrY
LADAPDAASLPTARELEVLRLLLAEKTTDNIAELLCLSSKTVTNMRYLIKCRLGVGSDIELVLLALRQGLLWSTARSAWAI